MAEMMMFQVAVIAIGAASLYGGGRLFLRYLELRRGTISADVLQLIHERLARLDRIELITETTAVEVERIAEANRFLAKLLAERPPVSLPTPPRVERVVTPH